MQKASVRVIKAAPPLFDDLITWIVEMSVESVQPDQIDQLNQIFCKAPDLRQCYYVTGDADFVLVIVTVTRTAYEAFIRQLFFNEPNVKNFRTCVAMDRVKAGLSVAL